MDGLSVTRFIFYTSILDSKKNENKSWLKQIAHYILSTTNLVGLQRLGCTLILHPTFAHSTNLRIKGVIRNLAKEILNYDKIRQKRRHFSVVVLDLMMLCFLKRSSQISQP